MSNLKPKFPHKTLEDRCEKEFISGGILHCNYESPCEYHTRGKIPFVQENIVGGRQYGCERKKYTI